MGEREHKTKQPHWHAPSRKELLAESSAFKRQTFYALENIERANWPGRIVGGALIALIMANAAVVFITAQPDLDAGAAQAFATFYRFSTACFALEYIARLWIAPLAYNGISSSRARLRYALSTLGIIDVLSFLPNMIGWFVPMTPTLQNIINVVRLVRLVKISRYMRGLRTIGRVLAMRRHEIVASIMVVLLLVVVSSVVMYEIEHPAQPKAFNNLLSGIYWAVTTVTSTGYGDIVPITPAGRIVGSIIMLLSVALVTIPAGILSAGFVAEFQNAKLRRIERDMHEDKDDENGKYADSEVGSVTQAVDQEDPDA